MSFSATGRRKWCFGGGVRGSQPGHTKRQRTRNWEKCSSRTVEGPGDLPAAEPKPKAPQRRSEPRALLGGGAAALKEGKAAPPSRIFEGAVASREHESHQVAIEPDQYALDGARYAPELSAAGQAHDLVFSTVDRLAFRPLPEVVETILRAHGFNLNLENILASLDDTRLGYRVRPSTRSTPPAGKPTASGFLPALTLQLPRKHRVGPLLAKFYAELEAFHAELVQLRAERGRARSEERTLVERLRTERDELERTNALLTRKLQELQAELASVKKAHAEATSALASQNLLPAQVRLAQVLEVDLETRNVELRAGRKRFSIPLVALWVFPEKDDPCLVSIQDGEVAGVFFHEAAQVPPNLVVAEVLHVAEGKCKIREESRKTRVICAQNPAEVELINHMQRGDRVLLFLHGQALIRFTPCGAFDPEPFIRAVQESIAKFEIESYGPRTP